MVEPQAKVFRAYNITQAWAPSFSYTLEVPQWSFEDVLIMPMTACDVPWTAAKAILGKEAGNKLSVISNSNVIRAYATAAAFEQAVDKASKSCEKFIAIATNGSAEWASKHLEVGKEIKVIRQAGKNVYCIMFPVDKCHEILENLREKHSFNLTALLNSYNPTTIPA